MLNIKRSVNRHGFKKCKKIQDLKIMSVTHIFLMHLRKFVFFFSLLSKNCSSFFLSRSVSNQFYFSFVHFLEHRLYSLMYHTHDVQSITEDETKKKKSLLFLLFFPLFFFCCCWCCCCLEYGVCVTTSMALLWICVIFFFVVVHSNSLEWWWWCWFWACYSL